ncbi:hypothetical protein Osc7112_4333 [Oscillatoria nigro-viridis PCC 7112]|uniref:Uncharacterized protein n=1 Tax=Phormidium nigroviride PCC 7112 TaxID=179408 RepID=K9VKM7_9CYAN|nr:hypothetical protein [Oscillatoria nigro-viridis]AFZ08643.1 hypothetical protein Osc7112_4333 [Oscillatoria nigro-viridis PCC 7112]
MGTAALRSYELEAGTGSHYSSETRLIPRCFVAKANILVETAFFSLTPLVENLLSFTNLYGRVV